MTPTQHVFLGKRGRKTWWPASSFAADLVKEALRLKKRRYQLQSRSPEKVDLWRAAFFLSVEYAMRFPPPVRYYAPLLVLVCGLAATWLDYELNLADDL